jgi:hypothetical protein
VSWRWRCRSNLQKRDVNRMVFDMPLSPCREPYAARSGKARVTAAVRLETCSLS